MSGKSIENKKSKMLPSASPLPHPKPTKETLQLGRQKFIILDKNRELEPFYLNSIRLLSTDIKIDKKIKGCKSFKINLSYLNTRAFVAGNFDKSEFLSIKESLIFIYKD